MKLSILVIGLGTIFSYCQKETNKIEPETLLFDSVPVVKSLTPLVNEISGIADSRNNPGFIWGHEDSGRPPQLFMIQHNGQVAKNIYIKNISNRDWEDICLTGNEIYIGEIGDNTETYNNYRFYKFSEPGPATDTVFQVETINFTYEDGSHDAEAFLVDPATKDIYIITKRDNPSKIYRIAYPYTDNNIAVLETSLPYMGVVSASISPDGKEILVKTYLNIYHYKRSQGESISQALNKTYKSLKYIIEPQGEALSFAANGNGFYTISEKGFASFVNIYFYKRN